MVLSTPDFSQARVIQERRTRCSLRRGVYSPSGERKVLSTEAGPPGLPSTNAGAGCPGTVGEVRKKLHAAASRKKMTMKGRLEAMNPSIKSLQPMLAGGISEPTPGSTVTLRTLELIAAAD